ncbi:MAG: sigma-54 dependent transcriptional regulator [Spirochaetaceae bacterium]|jgi:two-component system nitrogen regulation response regulator NtrX|nr:sigma-54 dependent transcriptional regulator [Spirochaetaceae bacterium]
MTTILIIDDEPGIRRTLASILEDERYKVFTAEDAIRGFDILEQESVSLVFLDVLLPNMGGMEALEHIRRNWPTVEVVIISGHANVDMAVRAVKLGAFDFLEKPLSLDKVLTVCRNAVSMQKLREENEGLKQKALLARDEIIGVSKLMNQVRELIRQAAASNARILITGENGTGKELVARAIHRLSARSSQPFVEVNCAAIPDSLLESELFGHEKGAFTDAVSRRRGRFEIAHRGTLFLDEIGDMSLSAQAKVLRVIQEQKIERVGGEKSLETDVRIVSATNKDLETECREGRFRQDLFFRLNVIPIKLPNLRERPEDIPLLLTHFLYEMDAAAIKFDDEAMDFLSSCPWPGNVRELKNLAERIVVMYNGDRLGIRDLEILLQKKVEDSSVHTSLGAGETPGTIEDIFNLHYNEAKELFERRYLEFHLMQNDGIISRTAESIGMYPSNLHTKLRKYRLRTER